MATTPSTMTTDAKAPSVPAVFNKFKNLDELTAEMVKRGNGREFHPCWCGHIGNHYGVWHQTPPCAHCDAWEKDAKSESNKDGHTVCCPKCGAGHWVKPGWNYR